jgi:hypothetical protein
MSYRKIAVFPLIWAAFFIALAVVVPADARKALFITQTDLSKGLATVGCFIAAYAFERGAYMRRAWSFNAWCYLLLLLRDLAINTFPPDATLFGMKNVALAGGLVFVANIASCVGTAMMARAWTTAGLVLPGSLSARIGVVAVAILLAIGISGSDLLVDGRALLGGDLASMHSVASDLGDIIGLALIAPVLLTAIAMRGGVLTWPWAFMTVSLVCWLLYDAISIIEHFLPGHEVAARVVRESFRTLACATECAAGLLQQRVITAPIDAEDAPAAE